MSLNGIRKAALACVLLAGGCMAQPAVPPTSVLLTDGAGLTAHDEIDGLDIATDTHASVHVVWRERSNVYGGDSPRARLVYRRGSGSPLHWGPRVVIADGGMGIGTPQVVVGADGVHIFAGEHLHHWLQVQVTDAFEDMGDMLVERDPLAGAFDAIVAGNAVMLAYTLPHARGDATVYGVRWVAGKTGRPFAIAHFSSGRAADLADPLLQLYGQRLVLLWTNIGFFDVMSAKPGQVPVVDNDVIVHASWSEDNGATWAEQRQVATFHGASVRALASTGTQGDPTVFFGSEGLFESRLAMAGWTPPSPIASYKPGFFAGSSETPAVAATQCNGHIALAWVDARHRKSDRRLWNFLGGFPWGDNPDWYNNDLFVITQVPPSASAAAEAVPLRMTADQSMTRDIAVAARGGQLLVFRSGRARVRKAPNDAGVPPAVTQSMVPCD